ncbi:hypothetical protein RE628_24690 [Paenibacillus sp. D2_2]|uniref:hypothetical protein n=1 Tax=Paenibacillus sp. D2_2 TaxID=3073092 RepID=UPI0028151B6C|nr:hypothetical protein [Paenibacillus sp. D2_2]WMT40371.1 hypothetical protein RE628_24690 [Paenibacillus sp. D2_2]
MSVIQIRDHNEMIEIHFSEVRKYHGSAALMALAVGFRVLQVAFAELYRDGIPDRKDIFILSGHGGPGFRDVYEFVTRAVTRQAYKVDTNYPRGQYDPYRSQSYSFVISNQEGAAVEVTLKEDFLPPIFYEYLKKGREGSMTESEHEANKLLKEKCCKRALELPLHELLYIRRLQ